MKDKKWLDGYEGQSAQQLIALKNEYRTDSIVLAFEQGIGQKAARQGDSSLTADERLVLAIEGLEREVNNGGYSQFFQNSSREYAATIVESLQRIGCRKAAEITRDAIEALHLQDLSDSQIEAEIEKEDAPRDATLQGCDKRYFKEAEAIGEQLFSYIRHHETNFRL